MRSLRNCDCEKSRYRETMLTSDLVGSLAISNTRKQNTKPLVSLLFNTIDFAQEAVVKDKNGPAGVKPLFLGGFGWTA